MKRGKPTPSPRSVLLGIFALLAAFLLPAGLARLSGSGSASGGESGAESYRRELKSYLWGGALAFVLTAIAFGFVHWSVLPYGWTMPVVGVLAFIQIVVHFRFFLHIDPPNQNTSDLMLILFTSLILMAMVGGTIWILGDLAARMH